MLVKLIEIKRGMRGGTASLSEIFINSSHIISVSEDVIMQETLVNEVKDLGLVSATTFSKVVLSEGNQVRTLTVVGNPHEIYNKIKRKQILKG